MYTVCNTNNAFTFQFYTVCDRWQREVDDNDAVTLAEQSAFADASGQVAAAVAAVARRLGFESGATTTTAAAEAAAKGGRMGRGSKRRTLELPDVLVMYEICRFERAKEPEKPSPWCAAFGREDLIVSHRRTVTACPFISAFLFRVLKVFKDLARPLPILKYKKKPKKPLNIKKNYGILC